VKTLVDANVLLDVITRDATWLSWSEGALRRAAEHSSLAINPIIFAEVSTKFIRIEACDDALAGFIREPLPYEAGFLAGKAFIAYRRRGGARRSPMPDFYVGAHAVIAQMQLLTRDAARYRTYFPGLKIVAPTRGAHRP
jgi:predicted nucleic acid-binding protein